MTEIAIPLLSPHRLGAVLLIVVLAVSGSSIGARAGEAPSPPDRAQGSTGTVVVEVVLIRDGEPVPGDDSVAWLPGIRPRGGDTEHLRIAQNKKLFEPRIASVSVGSTVDFPNYDKVFHNVFSLSSPKTFDLGLYRKGKSKSVRFDHPGLVQIYCNIHPHMAAYLMILDSGHHGVSDPRGIVTLDRVPVGRHSIEGWNLRGGRWDREVQVEPGRITEVRIELDISSWREPSHLNKHGKEYPPPDDEDFRY